MLESKCFKHKTLQPPVFIIYGRDALLSNLMQLPVSENEHTNQTRQIEEQPAAQ